MPGFSRRYTSNPGLGALSEIEGVAILDLAPPGAIEELGTGVVGIVGEFADMSRAVKVSNAAVVATDVRPVEIYSGQDMLNKVGGWDALLGAFGGDGGNGYATVRGKTYNRLIVAAVNLCSTRAVRTYRELPTCESETNPEPIVPMEAVTIPAGYEFVNSDRIRTAQLIAFTDEDDLTQGTDGTVAAVTDPATAATVLSGAETFDLRAPGASPHLRVVFDVGGNQDFDFTLQEAVKAGAGFAGPVTSSFDLQFENAPVQVGITITGAATVAAAVAEINGQITDGRAAVNGAEIDIHSDLLGTDSVVTLSNVVDTAGTSGLANGSAVEATSSCANASEVTAAEAAALLTATITNGTAVDVGGTLLLTSAITGAGSTAQVDAASTMDSRFGGEVASNAAKTGTAAGPGVAATNTFGSATATFETFGVQEGDLIVIGVIGGAAAFGANAGTYRVVTVTSNVALVVEKLDGSTWSFTTSAVMPFRVHPAASGDTGGNHQLSEIAGYTVPVRALDATVAASTVLAPTTPVAAGTGSLWLPKSGLSMIADPVTGVIYDSNRQADNSATTAQIEAEYQAALDVLLTDEEPGREVNILFTARTSANIRSALKLHVLDAAADGIGRVGIISPPVNEVDFDAIIGAVAPGVGVDRDERVDYSWPNAQVYVPEAVNYVIDTADGKTTDDGMLDMQASAFLASVLSSIVPERNPGEATPNTARALAGVKAFARGTPALSLKNYKRMKARGICGLRKSRNVGYVFQSGVTTSLVSGKKNQNRRRMADFIEDSISAGLMPMSKLPKTNGWKRDVESSVRAFLASLKSENNDELQRISDYAVDVKTGNTQEIEAAGLYVVIVQAVTLTTGDVIVLQAEIGEGVVLTTTS